jgi:hypothetical protein
VPGHSSAPDSERASERAITLRITSDLLKSSQMRSVARRRIAGIARR